MIGNETLKEILEMINTHENIKASCQASLRDIEKYLLSVGKPKGYGKGTSYVDADCIHGGREEFRLDTLQKIIEEQTHLENVIILESGILEHLYKAKKTMLDNLKDLEGIEYHVMYKKVCEHKQLQEIADELNYSLDRIKQISANIKKDNVTK